MRKNQIKTLLIVLLSGMILAGAGCKKDDNTKTNKDKLVGVNWKITAMTVSPAVEIGGVSYSDLFSFLPDCSRDDLTKFNSDGTANFDEGPTKCDSGDPQTTYGTWSLNADQTVLTVTSDDIPSDNTILELTDSAMKVSYVSVEDLGSGLISYTTTVTFAKQ